MSTPTKSPSLEDTLKAEIAEHGSLPFSRFMEIALYDGDHGYYAARKASIGKAGDFYTNVSTGAIFGKILCEQFEEIWHALETPTRFNIVEQGAFNGQFAFDVLKHAAAHNPAFFSALIYSIIEPFPLLREAQQKLLQPYREKTEWLESLSQCPEIEGVYFCNELVDALPVELVEWDGSKWQDRHVEIRDTQFVFRLHPLKNPDLIRRLEKIPTPQSAPYRTEINLESEPWIAEVAKKLKRGCLLICDYGYSRKSYYSAKRTEGTLSCYSAHRRSYDPLDLPGEKDITAHVDFTSLAESAIACGLIPIGFSDQHRFMVGAAEAFLKRVEKEGINSASQRDIRSLQILLHPETMGRAFHYLSFQHRLDITLSGFRHSPQGLKKLDDILPD
ncbi:MAG: SAM-dependent methyltransferase [Chthoniobacterales bacterium]